MTTMQRWELSLVSVPRPVPGADEVLVEVEAVSLNFRDSLITSRCRSEALPPVFVRTRPGRTWPNDAFSPWWPPRIGVES